LKQVFILNDTEQGKGNLCLSLIHLFQKLLHKICYDEIWIVRTEWRA